MSQDSCKANFILKITVVRKMLEILVTYQGKKVVISFYICSIASRETPLFKGSFHWIENFGEGSNSPLIQVWPDPA